MANSVYKTYEVTIDTMQDIGSSKTIRYSQNDLNSAKLLINIQHGGKDLDLSSATAVRISFRKQDGKLVYQDCQAINALSGKYQVVLNTQTLVVTGKVEFQVHIELPKQKLDTQKFFFVVDESLMSDETIESTNEFGIIQKAIDVGEQLKDVDVPALIASKETAEAAQAKANDNADKIGILQGINENTFSYTYKADGSVDIITEKDKNNTVISTTTFTYLANGDVDTSVKVMNGSTVTTKYNYDANGNLTSTVNTKA